MYVLVTTYENGAIVQRLHALDIRNGADQRGSPVAIEATGAGSSIASSGGDIAFDPAKQLSQAGLLLSDGKIYIAWTASCGSCASLNWLMAYDTTTLRQRGAWVKAFNSEADSLVVANGAGAIQADKSGNIRELKPARKDLGDSWAVSSSTSSNSGKDALVWTVQTEQLSNDGNEVLRAFDGLNRETELYNSSRNYSRDSAGRAVGSVIPTVVNGKVYVGAQRQVSVYGIYGASGMDDPQAATPVFSPGGGTYTSQQNVTITDATDGATIYYTTDGSTPTTSSPIYFIPIGVTQSMTIKAIAAASGYTNSNVATAVYTIVHGGGGSLDYGNGFTAGNLTFNGQASLNGTNLRLTDGGTGEVASAWYNTKVNVQAFTQDFSFQMTNARGDGMTFVIQNAGTTAIGPGGSGLGYGAKMPGGTLGIANSVAIKFDLYNSYGEGSNSTGLYTNGASPTIPAIDMLSSGIDLHRGNVLNVHMTYDGTTLKMTVSDYARNKTFTASWAIDIPGTIGSTTAYLGFTGASGGATAIQDVLNWTFASPYAVNYAKGFTPVGLALNGTAALNVTRLRLTDGSSGEKASAFYTTPVDVTAFSNYFAFQLTQPHGDGMTFVIQNAGTTALGPGGAGLGYGATSPGGAPGIPTSVAIKFDFYDNDGEGRNSTGLYTDGASPTVPAVDMTGSGVNLRSGDPFSVYMTYDGTTLTMRITDIVTKATFLTSWPIDIPSTVGGSTAYVGFTAASGGGTAIQEILNWSYGQ